MPVAGFVCRFLKPCAVAAFLAGVAACGGGSVDGGRASRMDVPVAAAWQRPTYDEASGVLALPAVQVGALTYTGVRLQNIGNYTFELRSATDQIPPGGAEVTYDEATGIVSIPAVAVDGKTYVNVALFNTGNYTFSLRAAWQLTSITVGTPTASPKEGDSVQLGAVAWGPEGNVIPGAKVTWLTSDPGIATVSASGLVQTLATGEVVVTAAINEVSAAQPLTITPIKVAVTFGAKEVVIAYNADRCPDQETPDGPPRFVRAEDGSLAMFDGRSYINRGADFGSLKRDCSTPALLMTNKASPESYENVEMLWAVYREGARWHALIHNEFHDPVASTCKPGDPTPANPCWYNSITYAVSTASGRSFLKPSPPAHVVAPAPKAWVPPPPDRPSPWWWYAEGYRTPTNIVRAGDGYYYSIIELAPDKFEETKGVCVMRTNQLDDPASWRAWDGSGFNLRMTSPYVTGSAAPLCTFLGRIAYMGGGHVVYSTYLNRFVLVAPGGVQVDGRHVCGFIFSLSADGVHWAEPQLLAEAKSAYCLAVTPGPGAIETVPTLYPSLVDHTDSTINFERAGQAAFLYYVRFNRGDMSDPMYWADRDVVRVQLTFNLVD